MSVSKKSNIIFILKARYKNFLFSLQMRRVYHALVVAYHYINFLSNGKKFLKKVIMLWSSGCYIKCRWSVTCCFRKIRGTMQFCWKNIFFSMQEDYASFSSTLVISYMTWTWSVTCLVIWISVTLYIENFFFDATNHTLFSSTKEVTFYTCRIKQANKMANAQET